MRTARPRTLRHRFAALAAWVVLLAGAGFFAARLPEVLQGGTDAIPGSESDRVTRIIERDFGPGALYQFIVVMQDEGTGNQDPRFAAAAQRLAGALDTLPSVRSVQTWWNAQRPELLGMDGHTALAVVTPRVASFFQAERLTKELRDVIRRAGLPPGFSAHVTGSTAMLHDLDEQSSSDLLAAERIGLPLTLVILLVVFGAPLAAALPLLLALAAVLIGLAGLYLMSPWVSVSIFAENVVSMIGLGVGVDYSLFIVSRFREELAAHAPAEAAARAVASAGHAVLFSGATVAIGFLGLFLVRAPFLHTIALGGMLVVAAAVAGALTLMPALLAWFGPAINWPRRPVGERRPARAGLSPWGRWASWVMKHRWVSLAVSLFVVLLFVLPSLRMRAWNIGARNLPLATEARQGYERLREGFSPGWMGPIVLLVEAPPGGSVWEPESRSAVLATVTSLSEDPRSGDVLGFAQILRVANLLGIPARSAADLPDQLRAAAADVVSADGRTALLALVTPEDPDDPRTMAFLRELRSRSWPELAAAGLQARIGGSAAIMADFDRELMGSLPRVVLAVVGLTFVALMVLFRSILIPLKATLLNVLSVLAAYGFLVLVFQDGLGARWIGLDPPGGLNSFIVLMLFTILFGLSMDYEVFLLSRIREAWQATGDNEGSVAAGLGATAGIISSAALIMISIFASFGFTRLIPTREFGLGLAFAVALDATLIRIVLVPALMVISGPWNWWFPGGTRKARRGPNAGELGGG